MTIWNSTCNPYFSTFYQIFFVFHGLKTGFFCYSLKLNFICYPNRFFIYDYSLWDGGDIRFCGQKQTLITSRYSHFNILFSKPCQRRYKLLPSLGVHRLSSVYFSHFNLLLWTPSAKRPETW